jgi:hypothetical protein
MLTHAIGQYARGAGTFQLMRGVEDKGRCEKNRSTIGFIGMEVGAVALLVAIIHFWMGPFSPQASLERNVA